MIALEYVLAMGLLTSPGPGIHGQDTEWDTSDTACLRCHGDESIKTLPGNVRSAMVRDPTTGAEPGAAERSPEYLEALHVESESEAKGVHGSLACTECHQGIPSLPHARQLPRVDCGSCHEKLAAQHSRSLHGAAIAAGDPLAPYCTECHGFHGILSSSDPEASTFVMNIPVLCGRCHREGSEVQRTHDISQHNILANYSLSIHGEGLFQKGLTVTAVCTSCHTSHQILPHDNPESSIAAANVANTCMQCHAQIEEVHTKVIEGKLWEEAPNLIPVCVDCHEPHKIRKVFYEEGMSDGDCMVCHSSTDTKMVRDGQVVSLKVHSEELSGSAHAKVRCAQCHSGGTPSLERPCDTIIEKVDCAVCHAEVVEDYQSSIHGSLAADDDPNAPVCRDCHGVHEIKTTEDRTSPIFPKNVPELCAQCHREGGVAATRYTGPESEIVKHYSMSIHGKGLLQSGLLVTATCVSCHTAHAVLPRMNPESTVYRDNIPSMCGNCHSGIYEEYERSVHSPAVTKGDANLPQCIDCHFAHTISRADEVDFQLTILQQCGGCHEEITATYFDTYHGKVSRLGSDKTAKCQDCHGSHAILQPSHPDSLLSEANIVATCGSCHPGSHASFTKYYAHATHHEPDKYPVLWATYWFMTCLLVGTMIVATLHTLAWLPASLRMRRELKKHPHKPNQPHYRRFPPIASKLHFVVIISFFGLTITGMALKFSYTGWALAISKLLGGFESMGLIHRICALLTFGYAGVHLWWLWRLKRQSNTTWLKFIFHENSLMFNLRDLREARDTLKWFVGLGPRPDYGRWTYWEKFDYFAVFWGVAIIGSSGLMLWFPEFFTLALPGWTLNVATVIHSDEALLAASFIFTIHFFNTHFRADKFPMDTVMFTGRIPLDELKRDKPREYQEWKAAGSPRDRLAPPLPDWYLFWARAFGFTAVTIGVTLVICMIYALFFASH